MKTPTPTKTTQDDLTAIIGDLSRQAGDVETKSHEARLRIDGLQNELASIEGRAAVYPVGKLQEMLSALLPQQLAKQQEHAAAVGTGLEPALASELDKISTEVESLRRELATWQSEMARDRDDGEATRAAIAEAQDTLIALTERRGELVGTRRRFEAQRRARIRETAAEELQMIDDELLAINASEEQKLTHRLDVLKQAARDLSSNEQECLQFLAVHGMWNSNPPAVVAAKKQLVAAQDEYEAVRRRVMQSDDESLKVSLTSQQLNINEMAARVDVARANYRHQQAVQLLAQVKKAS